MKERGVLRRTHVGVLKQRTLLLSALLLLGVLLLVAACSGSSNPGSQPNNTPSNGGYSLVQLMNQELHFLRMLAGR